MEKNKLTGWKEIANYLKQGVRTAQRWELSLKMPVRRTGPERSSVFAYEEELATWLSRSRVKDRPYVRPTLIVLDPPDISSLSTRKVALETHKFNVLTAFTPTEVLATAARFEVDAVVVDMERADAEAPDLCRELKQKYPAMVLVGMTTQAGRPAEDPIDYVVQQTFGSDELVRLAEELFGVPEVG
jgi:CheY-like chemotaxis protein